MKGQKLSSSILLAILFAGIVYAASFSLSSSSLIFTQSSNTSSFNVIPSNSSVFTDFSFITPTIKDDANNNIGITLNPSALTINESTPVNITLNVDYSKITFGKSYTGNLIIQNTANTSDNQSIALSIEKSFCDYGINGSGLTITSIKDENLDNKDDWEWNPNDNVEVTVKVSNDAKKDLDAIVEYGLYDPDNKEFIDLDEEEIDFSVDDGKSKEVTINFRVPADIDSDVSTKTLRFYAKAYEDGREKNLCTDRKDSSLYQEVKLKKESYNVVIADAEIPSSALCGEAISIIAKAYNIGRHDEDKVKVRLFNKELGLNIEKEFKNLDQGNGETLNFEFAIPQNATEKTYKLEFNTYFRYDEDTSTYDDISETYEFPLKVQGNCIKIDTRNAQITAILETADSDVQAGKDITIKTTIKNTGNETTTYAIGLEGNEAFSSLKSITPSSLTLNAGQSQDVSIVLSLNKDAEGDKTFSIKAIYNGKETKQQVALTIPSSRIGGITGFSIADSVKNNWFIWVIVAVNIILIALIIIVAVRVSRG